MEFLYRRITVDRDSVCAGDDCQTHRVTFDINPACSIVDLLEDAQRVFSLPSIIGGQATWLIEQDGYGEDYIAITAQQWLKPKLLIPEDTKILHLFSQSNIVIYFRYLGQISPDVVFETLKMGHKLAS